MAAPAEAGNIPVDNYGALITNALVDAGIVGVDEAIEPAILNRAFTQCNWILAQMARKRWLTYRIQDYSVVSNGNQTYSVGLGGDININPRPDRLEYAFLRFLQYQNGAGSLPVDIPIKIIQSHEDYSRITVKNIGTLPWQVFYDPVWPVGVMFPWPVPQPTIYEMHFGFKVVLPRATGVAQPINFPPEYEVYLNYELARRLRATYQLSEDTTITALAREAANTIRLANQAMGTLVMPTALRNRSRAYDYRGDTDSY